jgi:CHAD domain-containing protein
MARRSPIDSLLATRIAALDTAVPPALVGEPEGVHQARVASRRLREVVPVLEPVAPSAARAGHAVRRVTRALGPVRELDVTTALYAEWTQTSPRHSLADAAVRRILARERGAAIRAMRRALSPTRIAKLRLALDTLVRDASGVPVADVASAVQARVVQRARRLARALGGLGILYAPERLHTVRIAVKQLRYALEVRGRLFRVPTAASLRQLRAVQETLGRAHDLHVLGEHLRQVEARLVTRSRPAAADVCRLAGDIDEACRALHAAFLARRAAVAALASALLAPASPARRRTAA